VGVDQTQLVFLAVGLRDAAGAVFIGIAAGRVVVLSGEDADRVRVRRTSGRLPVARDLTGECSTGIRARHSHRTEQGRNKRLLTHRYSFPEFAPPPRSSAEPNFRGA